MRGAASAMQRMARLAERAEDACTQPLRRGTGVEPLTGREREVALLAASGMATKDIASRLFLSARTVDTHLARIYRKLGVAGRAELADALGRPGVTQLKLQRQPPMRQLAVVVRRSGV